MPFKFVCLFALTLVSGARNSTDIDIPPHPPSAWYDDLAEMKQGLRTEMYSLLGGMTRERGQDDLLDIIKELIGEVKYYQQLTLEQTVEITQLEAYRETTLEKLDEVTSKLDELRGDQEITMAKLGELQTNQQSTLEQLSEFEGEQELSMAKLGELQTNQETNQEMTMAKLGELQTNHESDQEITMAKLGELQTNQDSTLEQLSEFEGDQELSMTKLGELKSNQDSSLSQLVKLERRMDLVRDEVRLISQQKLAWQNVTHTGYVPDFAVDGVYKRVDDMNGHNPTTHSNTNARNNVLIIDLGAVFKIHTIKVFGRISAAGQARLIGVLVYADEALIGAISESKFLHNIKVYGTVFGRRVILKQAAANYMDILEVQVFGTGPYGEDEIYVSIGRY